MPKSIVQILFNNKMRGREIERDREETGGERLRETQINTIVDPAVSYWSFITQGISVVGNLSPFRTFYNMF